MTTEKTPENEKSSIDSTDSYVHVDPIPSTGIAKSVRNILMGAALFSTGCGENTTQENAKIDGQFPPITKLNDATPTPKQTINSTQKRDGNYDGAIRDEKYKDTMIFMMNDPDFDINEPKAKEMIKKYNIVPSERLKALADYRSTGGHVSYLSIGLDYAEQSKNFSQWCKESNYANVAREEEGVLEMHLKMQKSLKKDR